MRRILMMSSLVALFSALAFAETWKGRLLDVTCLEKQQTAACDATISTTAFAIAVSDQAYRLDAEGNEKAVEALKSRADRSQDPDRPSGPVTATVTGEMQGGTIKVESISVD